MNNKLFTSNDIQTIKNYLNQGGYLESKDYLGNTPLLYHVLRGNYDIVQLLINNGANLYHENMYNQNALHLAVKSGNIHIVRELLKYDLDINGQDVLGNTPLHFWYEYSDNKSIYYELIKNGASEYIENNIDLCPFHIPNKDLIIYKRNFEFLKDNLDSSKNQFL